MIVDLVNKKSSGYVLEQEDFDEAINYLMDNGADDDIVKFFLALDEQGMTKDEVLCFACAIRDSGRVLRFDELIFEKHSTGGIGDASSLVIVPLLASLGYKIIKTTGKSLVYTNGGADRLKAIPNFKTKFTDFQINSILGRANACFLSHNTDICPADRLLYDIREKHHLHNNLDFIAASIAAKKMASGAKVVLIDIKYGQASMVKSYKQAIKLAKLLKFIFDKHDIKSVLVLTSTVQTLGEGIGNAIEVVDALNVLQGKRTFLRRVANKFAVELMCASDPTLSKADAYEIVNMAIDGGAAYKQFMKIVECQGGDISCLQNATIFRPYHSVNFKADKAGYVGQIDSLMLGELVRRLCVDNHDDNIGVVLRVKIGDFVLPGDVVMSFYYKDPADLDRYKSALAGAVRMTNQKIKKVRVVKKVIS